MVQQHDNSKKHRSNSTAKSGRATKTLPKQQQETLALAEITLNKDFINIINLNLTRENSKRSRRSEKKSSKINHITFENSVTATLRQSKLELD